MKYIATYKVDGEFHVLHFAPQPPLDQKLTIHDFSYAKAVESAEKLISELTLDIDPEIQVLLID